jgi:N-acyl-L-homoserine lactone synthetase
MIMLVESFSYAHFPDELAQMHRLRYRVFKERMDWNVTTDGDREIDTFDASSPVYLLYRQGDRSPIEGCVRLLPSTGPTMLRDVFAVLANGNAAENRAVWESSRFAVDTSSLGPTTPSGLAAATCQLFAGMIEFGLYRNLASIVTVTDVRLERLLRRVNWPLSRMAEPRFVDGTLSVAGHLEVSSEALSRLRHAAQIRGPVLWVPALLTCKRLNVSASGTP